MVKFEVPGMTLNETRVRGRPLDKSVCASSIQQDRDTRIYDNRLASILRFPTSLISTNVFNNVASILIKSKSLLVSKILGRTNYMRHLDTQPL